MRAPWVSDKIDKTCLKCDQTCKQHAEVVLCNHYHYTKPMSAKQLQEEREANLATMMSKLQKLHRPKAAPSKPVQPKPVVGDWRERLHALHAKEQGSNATNS
jgi:hypothetical protein